METAIITFIVVLIILSVIITGLLIHLTIEQHKIKSVKKIKILDARERPGNHQDLIIIHKSARKINVPVMYSLN